MKPILLLVLIAFSPNLQQRMAEREDPDLRVVKFSWAKERQNTGLIRGAKNPGGPITTPISNDRDLGSRRADMRNLERKAAGSAETSGDTYQFRLEVKNTGTKVVRTLIWEFKPTAGPDDYEPKQYLCKLRVKPKEKEILDLWTPYAPVKVISVEARANALADGEVIINKIEYADGSVWKRHRWNIELPPDSSQKLSEGKCSVF